MPWRRNKSALARDFPDLEYLPRGRAAWDCTLACLAYAMRMDLPAATADVNAWATHHGLPASKACADLGDSAMVLWHGTSRDRAEKIQQHGLFHKKGLWTARHPNVPHSFCRNRSEQFGTAGAVLCLVLDQNEFVEGRDYEAEANGNVLRFHHGLPPDAVAYVLVKEEIRFTGPECASEPKPWPGARFKHTSGQWRPVQKAPVRFSASESFSTLDEYLRLCLAKLLRELNGATPLEVLSVLFSLVDPWEPLRHSQVLELLETVSSKTTKAGKRTLFLP